MPWELTRAVEHANRILDWQENLMSDDMPPAWMWHLDEELHDWFQEVEERHDSNSPRDDREQVPLTKNEFSWDKGR